MSAPIKCEKCGAKSFYAIQTPCVQQCGGMMYYDKPASPASGLREAAQAALDWFDADTKGINSLHPAAEVRRMLSRALTALPVSRDARETRLLQEAAEKVVRVADHDDMDGGGAGDLYNMIAKDDIRALRAALSAPAGKENET